MHEPAPTPVPPRLLRRDDDPSRPSLENRIAYQWESGLDTLGYRSGRLRDATMLQWAGTTLEAAARPASVLDLGCSYGNILFMLDARTGCDPNIRFTGVDLDERGLAYGNAFAASVPGYDNCRFQLHDITTALPFEDNSFDVVLAADVLEHLPDVRSTLREIRRVVRPSGCFVLSTPLAQSTFKRVAVTLNRLTRGRLNQSYYEGKNTELDEHGEPIMVVDVGHDHISEMPYTELVEVVAAAGFELQAQALSPVMSGSRWFDSHPFLLASLLGLEAVQTRLQRPSWAHGICLQLRAAD